MTSPGKGADLEKFGNLGILCKSVGDVHTSQLHIKNSTGVNYADVFVIHGVVTVILKRGNHFVEWSTKSQPNSRDR